MHQSARVHAPAALLQAKIVPYANLTLHAACNAFKFMEISNEQSIAAIHIRAQAEKKI